MLLRLPTSRCNQTCRLLKQLPGNATFLILSFPYLYVDTHPSTLIDSLQVKPSKRAKKNKPSQDPVVTEPAIDSSVPDSSTHPPPPEPAFSIPVSTSDPPAEDAVHDSDNPEIHSPVKRNDPEVEIVKSQFVEPGRPTVLAKCTAKEEFAQRRKAKQDITDYTHLSIGDIVSGYLNQVHNSRDLEVDMVKQIQHKSEV